MTTTIKQLVTRRTLLKTISVGALAASMPFGTAQTQSREFRIGHQKGFLSILKSRGTLEKRLTPLGVSVKWIEFLSGPPQLEALNVGSIDFGDVGEAPPIFAQAAGAPLVYYGATVARPQQEAVIVPKGSPIRSVAELKGKKVALNRGSNVQYFLAKLLPKHGLSYGDVNLLFLPPTDARAAFERGSIDAWVIWDPFLAAAERQIEARVLADARGVVNNRGYYFTSKQYQAKNDDLLRIALEEVTSVEAWAAANRAPAADELARVLGLERSILDLAVNRGGYGVIPINRSIIAEQQEIADTFFELKLIPKRISV
ncbi:MAG: sulfonate ABC transporter substrate-binding protein, partial [Burkholderiales bacterium]